MASDARPLLYGPCLRGLADDNRSTSASEQGLAILALAKDPVNIKNDLAWAGADLLHLIQSGQTTLDRQTIYDLISQAEQEGYRLSRRQAPLRNFARPQLAPIAQDQYSRADSLRRGRAYIAAIDHQGDGEHEAAWAALVCLFALAHQTDLGSNRDHLIDEIIDCYYCDLYEWQAPIAQ